MRHIFIASLMMCQILIAHTLMAQSPKRAVTDTGQRVLLFPDGTWKPELAEPPREIPVGDIPAPKKVTLLSRTKYGDYEKATFSFEQGIRDDPDLKLTRNDWDLLYGNGGDALDVTMVTDDCSRIRDLGPLEWSELMTIPELPAYSTPQREPGLPAILGHMYLVHTRDSNSDFYALFRVEELKHADSCTITWALIPTLDQKARLQ